MGMGPCDFRTITEAMLLDLRRQYEAKHPILGQGRNRVVFRVSEVEVVKIPLGEIGIHGNITEADIYAREGKDGYIPYAACELFYSEEGIPLLRMEYITRFSEAWSGLPKWADYVDGCQVGYDSEGRLVAYDYE